MERWRLREWDEILSRDVADDGNNFLEKHDEDDDTAGERCYSYILLPAGTVLVLPEKRWKRLSKPERCIELKKK